MKEKLGKISLWTVTLIIAQATSAISFDCIDLFNEAYENQDFGQIKLNEAHHLEVEGQYEIAISDYRNAVEYLDTAIFQYQQLPIKFTSCTYDILEQTEKNVELALKNKQSAQTALLDLDCYAQMEKAETLLENAGNAYHERKDSETAEHMIHNANKLILQLLQQEECASVDNQTLLKNFQHYAMLFQNRLNAQMQYQQCRGLMDELLLSEASAKKTSFFNNTNISLAAWLLTVKKADTVLAQKNEICTKQQIQHAQNIRRNAQKKIQPLAQR